MILVLIYHHCLPMAYSLAVEKGCDQHACSPSLALTKPRGSKKWPEKKIPTNLTAVL